MSEPVTRGEMHEALEVWAGAIIEKVSKVVDERFAKLDERFAKIDERFAKIDERFAEIPHFIQASADDVMERTRVEILASEERVITRVEGMLDPYKPLPAKVAALEQHALPERVTRLEAKVFAPKRRTRRTPRTR